MELNKIFFGDNLKVLKKFPDNSIDAIITDPPYGINMMGCAWDGKNILDRAIKRKEGTECPDTGPNGGHKSIAAAAGQYDRSSIANYAFQKFTEEWSRECLRVLKPGGHLVSFASTRTYHRMTVGIEDAGFEIRDQLAWVFGSGFPKSHNLHGDYEGWGTALKPAYEPIALARKPLEKGFTVAQNMAKWGTGAINIDATRIEFESDADLDSATFGVQPNIRGGKFNSPEILPVNATNVKANPSGRWPANFIHDGSPEVLNGFPDSDGQNGIALQDLKSASNKIFGKNKNMTYNPEPRNDSGSAARFFYCAKTSSSERNLGLEDFEKKTSGMVSNTSGQHLTRRDGGAPAPKANNHPTVKPIALMIWLIKLITPVGGAICDPFSGSGTTKCAANILGVKCAAIEREKDYIKISEARAAYWNTKRWNDYQAGLKPQVKIISENQLELF